MGTLHEDVFTRILSRLISPKMRSFWIKFVEKIETHFMFNFFSKNRAIYGIIWRNMVETDGLQANRLQMAVQYGVCELRAG